MPLDAKANVSLSSRTGNLFYWCTALSTLLMIAFVILVWFKKLWDYFRPTQDADFSMTTPPDNRFLKWLYDFSFDIMSHAVWRMAIYVMVVIILVAVSLLHLV